MSRTELVAFAPVALLAMGAVFGWRGIAQLRRTFAGRGEPLLLRALDSEKKPGLSLDEALAEANRCLSCYDAPCTRACPTHIDVPRFIKRIASENPLGAARTILSANILGASCARVC